MSLYTYILHKFNNNFDLNKLFIAVLIIIFSAISYFAYIHYLSPLLGTNKAFKDVANNSARELEVYFVYANWCRHCIDAKPEWNTFKSQNDNKLINNYLAVCNEMNCSDQDDEAVKLYINNNNIVSYPTVYIIKENVRYDFDAAVSNKNLSDFLSKVSLL
jgi:thiol-disulfide isomerase/thioredoxin